MRRKTLEKIKEDLKKDLKKEMENDAKKEKKVPVVKELKEPVHHSKEELHEIQKNFLKILIFAGIILFILIILILRPNISGKEKTIKPQEEEVETNVDTIYDLIEKQANGQLDHNNKYILQLFDQLKLLSNEYYFYDSTYLYSKDMLLTSEIPSDYLLFMLSKTVSFKQYILSTKLLTKEEICSDNATIRIPGSDIGDLISKEFNVNIDEYRDFIYTHYVDENFSTYIKFIYSDGYYISSCYEQLGDFPYDTIADMLIEDAYKNDDELRIGVRVVFMDSNYVYGDYQKKRLIAANTSADILQYISNADKYEFVYRFNGSNYYLESIVRVNENS